VQDEGVASGVVKRALGGGEVNTDKRGLSIAISEGRAARIPADSDSIIIASGKNVVAEGEGAGGSDGGRAILAEIRKI
jgi:hypothetical protein